MSKGKNKKVINDLHAELSNPSEEVTWATGKEMRLHLNGMLKFCKAFDLGKAIKAVVDKMAIPCTIIKGKRLFINISFLFTANVGGKKHWIFMVADSLDCALS